MIPIGHADRHGASTNRHSNNTPPKLMNVTLAATEKLAAALGVRLSLIPGTLVRRAGCALATGDRRAGCPLPR